MINAEQFDVDLTKVAELGDQLIGQLSALRERSPIYWSERQKAWLVTGHAEVLEGFRGMLPLSSNRLPRLFTYVPQEERDRRIPYMMKSLSRFLISLDPPEQIRIRKLMTKAFSRRVAEGHRAEAKAIIAATLDAAASSERVEFVEGVARRIAGHMILRLMGLPDDFYPRLCKWTVALSKGLSGGGTTLQMIYDCEAALLDMRDVFSREISARRAAPREDFISMLVTAEENGQRLDEEDVLAICYLALAAGNDTTTNTMTLGVIAAGRDPRVWTELRTRSGNLEAAIMELMRHIAMSTSQVRVAAEDFEWKGHSLRKGDLVYLMIAGANRDPRVFENPEKMDFDRPQTLNLTFAPGMHFCIGHHLAKLQLTEFFAALVERFDGLDILDGHLDWSTPIGFRGLKSLHLRFHPRRQS